MANPLRRVQVAIQRIQRAFVAVYNSPVFIQSTQALKELFRSLYWYVARYVALS